MCSTTASLQDRIGAVPEHIPFRTRVAQNFWRFLAPSHKRSGTTADRLGGVVATSNPFSAMLICARNCEGGSIIPPVLDFIGDNADAVPTGEVPDFLVLS